MQLLEWEKRPYLTRYWELVFAFNDKEDFKGIEGVTEEINRMLKAMKPLPNMEELYHMRHKIPMTVIIAVINCLKRIPYKG